jgi:hypothetical protein
MFWISQIKKQEAQLGANSVTLNQHALPIL